MISSEAEDRAQRAVAPVAILSAIQRKTLSVEDQRKHWLGEIDGLTRLLNKIQKEPDSTGLTLGALGGIAYAINQLQISHGGSLDVDGLADRYATDELKSYATTREEIDQIVQHFGRPGMDIRVDKISLETGHVYFRVYLGSDYGDPHSKRSIPAGTMLANTQREYPPLSQVHMRF